MQTQHSSPLPLVRGKLKEAQRVGLYGPEGVGKSTLAACCPNPVFLDTEGGTAHLDITRFPKPRSWEEVLAFVEQLAGTDHDFETFVIDTVDWLERLLAEYICRKSHKDSIEEFGYGKGYTYLGEEFSRFLKRLDDLRESGVHIVVVAHSTIRKFEQPDASGAYDRYELKLSKQCAPLLKEWCDLLLFVNYFTKVTDTDGKKRAVGGKERRIYTTHCAAYDAKNRHALAEQLPMTFEAISPIFEKIEKPATNVPAIATSENSGQCSDQQIQNILKLWGRLNYGQEQKTKLFQWLEADSLIGVEEWSELTGSQAARAIGFLTKKIQEAAQ